MNDDVKERVARALIEGDSGPVGSALFVVHAAEFGKGYAGYAETALAALRPGDEINGCVLVPKRVPRPCCFDIPGSDRVRGQDEPCGSCDERNAAEKG